MAAPTYAVLDLLFKLLVSLYTLDCVLPYETLTPQVAGRTDNLLKSRTDKTLPLRGSVGVCAVVHKIRNQKCVFLSSNRSPRTNLFQVLVPGGKLYFYEHTRNFEENNRLMTFAQVVLFVPYLSIFYCNTLVNQLPALFKVFGESNVEFRQFVVVKEGVAKVILYPVSPHVAGKAIKGENARVLSKDMVSDKQQ